MVLRERGGLNKEYPTIEITKGDSTDKIFYMGKGWNRIFYKRKQ